MHCLGRITSNETKHIKRSVFFLFVSRHSEGSIKTTDLSYQWNLTPDNKKIQEIVENNDFVKRSEKKHIEDINQNIIQF